MTLSSHLLDEHAQALSLAPIRRLGHGDEIRPDVHEIEQAPQDGRGALRSGHLLGEIGAADGVRCPCGLHRIVLVSVPADPAVYGHGHRDYTAVCSCGCAAGAGYDARPDDALVTCEACAEVIAGRDWFDRFAGQAARFGYRVER